MLQAKRHLTHNERVRVSAQPTCAPDLPHAVRWGVSLDFLAGLRQTILYHWFPDQLDPRDWMHPEVSEEPLEDDGLWFDYIADTGDAGRAVVALGMLVQGDLHVRGPDVGSDVTADWPDGHVKLPWGRFLVVGGDTGYSVAMEKTIGLRLVAPWNWARHLRVSLPNPGEPNVGRHLYGIPGNHDWYDSLDGFNRLFRRLVGGPGGLEMREYKAVQEASYFAIRLTGGTEAARQWSLVGLDVPDIGREEPALDTRQSAFFSSVERTPKRIIMTPEPARRHDEDAPWYTSRGIDGYSVKKDAPDGTRVLVSGDVHHYARYHDAKNAPDDHIVQCGLGGTLAHPTHIHDPHVPEAERQLRQKMWPDPEASRKRYDWAVAPWSVRAGSLGAVLGLLLGLGPVGLGSWTAVGHLAFDLVLVALAATGSLWWLRRMQGKPPWLKALGPLALFVGAMLVAEYLVHPHNGARRLFLELLWHTLVLAFLVGFTLFAASGAQLKNGPRPLAMALVGLTIALVVVVVPAGVSAWVSQSCDFGVATMPVALAAASLAGLATVLLMLGLFIAVTVRLGGFPTEAGAWGRDQGQVAFVRFHIHPDGVLEGWVIGAQAPKGQSFQAGPELPKATLIDHFRVG